LLLVCLSFFTFAQLPETKEGTKFDSVFQNLKEGVFSGNASGEIREVNLSGDTVRIKFDKVSAILQIEPDQDEVYDVSRKIYLWELKVGWIFLIVSCQQDLVEMVLFIRKREKFI